MQAGNIVLVGESGSGKTEIAVNLALRLAREGSAQTVLIDLDQTKTLFRARDFSALLTAGQVRLARNLEFWDSPLMPEGVSNYLQDPALHCVMDVGGNAIGAAMLGQFSQFFLQKPSQFYFVINPCRAFSGSLLEIRETLTAIVHAARIPEGMLDIIINPYLGEWTTAKLVLEQAQALSGQLTGCGYRVAWLAVARVLADEVGKASKLPLLVLDPYVNSLYV